MSARLIRMLLLMVIWSPCLGVAGWQPIGPYGGHALKVVIDPQNPSRLFVATKNGQLYQTTNGGDLWNRVRLPAKSGVSLNALAMDPANPRILYVGTVKDALDTSPSPLAAIWKTEDGGQSWRPLDSTLAWGVLSLAIHPQEAQTLVAGALDGVFLSRDGGIQFRQISPPGHPEIRNIVSVAFDREDLRVVYAGTPHLPWRTTDGGHTWTSIHQGMIDDSDIFSICVDWSDSSKIYASACSGIYCSSNRGTQWAKMRGIPGTNRRTHLILQDPLDPKILYAGTTQGLWKSLDGGRTWQKPNPYAYVVNWIAIDPSNPRRLYLATDRSGILKSEDGGRSFRAANNGFINRNVTEIWAEEILYASSAYDGDFGGIFMSRDEGNSWSLAANQPALNGQNIISLAVSPADSKILLAGTHQGLLRSTNGGHSWETIMGGVDAPTTSRRAVAGRTVKPAHGLLSDEIPQGQVYQLVFSKQVSPILYAGAARGLYQSSDYGAHWKRVKSLPSGLAVYKLALHPERTNQILLHTSAGILYSEDGGLTWSRAEMSRNPRVLDIAIHPELRQVWAGTSHGLYVSSDSGKTWSPPRGELPAIPIDQILIWPEGSGSFVLSARNNQIYVSPNGVDSWQRFTQEGLEDVTIQKLYLRNFGRRNLFALTQNQGVYQLSHEVFLVGRAPEKRELSAIHKRSNP
ncbi:MAG: hypothetical protein L0387_20800 [Acidobacteria bacterium]|nr:hypothetical protein [Acidobacteriota bacterium]MCI0624060.1 hypothetical protein [Acidobacteriota bacterium]MCI0719035.1 hypothetical protein [Acidobacteriota bacterium]